MYYSHKCTLHSGNTYIKDKYNSMKTPAYRGGKHIVIDTTHARGVRRMNKQYCALHHTITHPLRFGELNSPSYLIRKIRSLWNCYIQDLFETSVTIHFIYFFKNIFNKYFYFYIISPISYILFNLKS